MKRSSCGEQSEKYLGRRVILLSFLLSDTLILVISLFIGLLCNVFLDFLCNWSFILLNIMAHPLISFIFEQTNITLSNSTVTTQILWPDSPLRSLCFGTPLPHAFSLHCSPSSNICNLIIFVLVCFRYPQNGSSLNSDTLVTDEFHESKTVSDIQQVLNFCCCFYWMYFL